jgi:hypothetical protein
MNLAGVVRSLPRESEHSMYDCWFQIAMFFERLCRFSIAQVQEFDRHESEFWAPMTGS